MRKVTLIILSVSFFIATTGCQEPINPEEDSVKVQEAVEKIKARIQEDLGTKSNDETSAATEK